LRFVVLGIIIVYPLLKQEKLFGKIDPFKTLFNLDGSITLVILLGFVLLTSIFIYRPYCRYFCPFGAVLGAVNALGFFKLQFNGVCTACRICEKSCMFDALKAKNLSSPVVDKTICIACMECTRACPKKVLEENKILGKKRDFQADLVV
jgi:polyferredoxin